MSSVAFYLHMNEPRVLYCRIFAIRLPEYSSNALLKDYSVYLKDQKTSLIVQSRISICSNFHGNAIITGIRIYHAHFTFSSHCF